MNAVYRPLALHGLVRANEAKQLFRDTSVDLSWMDSAEPVKDGCEADGILIASCLAYKEAAKALGVALKKPTDKS